MATALQTVSGQRADAALYSAKAAGRNRVFYHTGLEIHSAEEAGAAEMPAHAELAAEQDDPEPTLRHDVLAREQAV